MKKTITVALGLLTLTTSLAHADAHYVLTWEPGAIKVLSESEDLIHVPCKTGDGACGLETTVLKLKLPNTECNEGDENTYSYRYDYLEAGSRFSPKTNTLELNVIARKKLPEGPGKITGLCEGFRAEHEVNVYVGVIINKKGPALKIVPPSFNRAYLN